MRSTQQFSITLPNEMADAVRAKVAAGGYATESEVTRDGLRALLARDRAVEDWLRSESLCFLKNEESPAGKPDGLSCWPYACRLGGFAATRSGEAREAEAYQRQGSGLRNLSCAAATNINGFWNICQYSVYAIGNISHSKILCIDMVKITPVLRRENVVSVTRERVRKIDSTRVTRSDEISPKRVDPPLCRRCNAPAFGYTVGSWLNIA